MLHDLSKWSINKWDIIIRIIKETETFVVILIIMKIIRTAYQLLITHFIMYIDYHYVSSRHIWRWWGDTINGMYADIFGILRFPFKLNISHFPSFVRIYFRWTLTLFYVHKNNLDFSTDVFKALATHFFRWLPNSLRERNGNYVIKHCVNRYSDLTRQDDFFVCDFLTRRKKCSWLHFFLTWLL